MAATAEAPAAARPAQQAVVPALPFVSASHEYTEFIDLGSFALGASDIQVNADLPAYGYARAAWIEITASGGAGGTVNADFPWNILKQLTLQDVGGQNIVGPIDGYPLWVVNTLLAPYIQSDPGAAPFHVGSGPNPKFFLRVPIEIRPSDGLGSLANLNASANMKLAFTLSKVADLTSVAFTTPPTLRIRVGLEAWTLPAKADRKGRPQQQTPPMVGTGQIISARRESGIGVGNNTLQLKRVGNLIRTVVMISRDATGARNDGVFPDPVSFEWDGNTIRKSNTQAYWQNLFAERSPRGNARPAGVWVLPFNTGGAGRSGNEDPSGWLPTVHSSRLEVSGPSAVAGTIEVITVEVRAVETNQAERWQAPNDTSYQPPV